MLNVIQMEFGQFDNITLVVDVVSLVSKDCPKVLLNTALSPKNKNAMGAKCFEVNILTWLMGIVEKRKNL